MKARNAPSEAVVPDVSGLGGGDEVLSPEILWEEIGIHRALGGVWYRSVIQLVAILFLFVVGAIVIPTLAPYPSVQGYRGVVNQMMALTFTIFDVGIGASLIRYVAEYRVRDLPKALEYASFFVWFQAFTGVVQITIITYWGLAFLPSTNVAYAAWFIMTYSLIQWPSSTGIFRDLLKSFQHHDKAQLIEIAQGALVEVFTEVTCIFLFRQWGIANPRYGELMGITIGWILGVMLDDVICMAIAGHWFSNVLRDVSEGTLSAWDVIKPQFSKETIKESLVFGAQSMGASLLDALKGTVLVWVWVAFMPSYAFYVGIVQLAGSLTLRAGGELNTGIIPAITEAHNNRKERLTKYYVAKGFKYMFFFIVFMDVLNFAVFPYILGAVLEVTGEYFLLSVVVIPLQVVVWNFDPLVGFFKDVVRNTGHVTLFLGLSALNVGIDLATAAWLTISVGGWVTLVAYPLPGKVVVLLAAAFYVKRRVIDYELPRWQSFGAPALAGVTYFAFSRLFTKTVAPVFIGLDPLGGAILMLAFSFLAIPMFVFIPLYALFGGFDAQGMRDFEKAVALAGPSRWLVKRSFAIAKKVTNWNPLRLHDRYPVPTGGVLEDVRELMELKAKAARANAATG